MSQEHKGPDIYVYLGDTGMGTTPGMWELLSEMLVGEALPEPINNAIYALREGRATVTLSRRPYE